MLVRKKNYYHQNLPNETKLTYQNLIKFIFFGDLSTTNRTLSR